VKVRPPGVNFINILCAAFVCADPESENRKVKLLVVFLLLESSCTKTARRTSMKLIPGEAKLDGLIRQLAFAVDDS